MKWGLFDHARQYTLLIRLSVQVNLIYGVHTDYYAHDLRLRRTKCV